jgi:hypothetical protein
MRDAYSEALRCAAEAAAVPPGPPAALPLPPGRPREAVSLVLFALDGGATAVLNAVRSRMTAT